jgi:hypothetical protein
MPREWTEEERRASSLAATERHRLKRLEVAEARIVAAAAPEPEPTLMPAVPREGELRGEPDDWQPPAPLLGDIPVVGLPDPFEAFLAAQDAETRAVLTDAELRVIYELEVKRAAEAKHAAAKKLAAHRAQRHAQAVDGLIPAEQLAAAAQRERLNRKVSWVVNMPEAGNSGMLIDEGVRIDGRLLYHGQKVTGTLAEYESYRSIEWLAHQNELDFQGRGRLSRLRQTATGFINNRTSA